MDGSSQAASQQQPGKYATPERPQLLLEINNAIVSHLDLAQLMKAISSCLRQAIPHDFAGLSIYDPERNVLRVHALEFPPGKQFIQMWQEIPIEDTPPGLAFKSRRPLLRHRLDPNEFHFPLVKELVDSGIRSVCNVPLICQGRGVGAMGVASFQEGAFTEEDAELLNQIGGQVAFAVENALHFQQLRLAEQQVALERDRSRLLLEINNAVV
jgi:formate hydrogenlyase transcriptional activator